MEDFNKEFKEMYKTVLQNVCKLYEANEARDKVADREKQNEKFINWKLQLDVNPIFEERFIECISKQKTSAANDVIISILSNKKIKKTYFIDDLSTYNDAGLMELNEDTIVYIAVKDKMKDTLLCVFPLKED
ncbi:MAG: hypothetical protein PUJ51_03595 [Clostridiales bacterium]|nr:hypothetical protein [Clostridiales bacterium]